MIKTAQGLVDYALGQVGRPYWRGGFGQQATEDLYRQNKDRLGYGDFETIYKPTLGQKVHDCNGLIKGYCWTDGPDVFYRAGQYETNGCGDWSVEEMYNRCSQKSAISLRSVPMKKGVLVFSKTFSHMGVYDGSEYVIEARDVGLGVQKNRLADRSFYYWGMLESCIDYSQPDEEDFTEPIKAFQRFLNEKYSSGLAVDGRVGPATRTAAVKAMQTELNKLGEKLVVDGGFGSLSKTAMSRHMITKISRGDRPYIVQGLLYGAGYDPKGFDGSYNVGAEAAVKRYQKDNGLEVDGKVGGETFAKLVGR